MVPGAGAGMSGQADGDQIWIQCGECKEKIAPLEKLESIICLDELEIVLIEGIIKCPYCGSGRRVVVNDRNKAGMI